MEKYNYKRQDRSVPPETAEKISKALKLFNLRHPRGKASDGSEWSKKISDSLRTDTGGYWSKIPPKKTDFTDLI